MKQIKTVEQLNESMLEHAKVTAKIQEADAIFQAKLDEITEKREKITGPLSVVKEKLEVSIKDYAITNREELFPDGIKTYKSPYGTISFRLGKSSLAFESDEIVISNIKRNPFRWFFNKKYRAAIRIKCTVAKDVLKDFSDDELKVIGVARVAPEENINIVPNLETLNKLTKAKVQA